MARQTVQGCCRVFATVLPNGEIPLQLTSRANPASALVFALVLALLSASCAHQSSRPSPPVVEGDGLATTLITEAFVVAAPAGSEVDSLATWVSPEGEVRVIASAKYAGNLLVYDGSDGTLLLQAMPAGTLAYPNGLAIYGDTLFVVERDAGRVQVYQLPEFSGRGQFGAEQLRSPYGIWLHESAPDEVEVLVTDSYQDDDDQLPPLSALDRRIQRFRVQLAPDAIQVRHLGSFGETRPEGALRWVESIAGDVAFNRLVIAEEHPDFRDRGAAIYDLEGRYTGQRLGDGLIQGDQEGIALYECPSGNGYWITTDQGLEVNRFHVFDRASLDYLGSFSGRSTLNTDGIAFYPAASERFPYGVLYAVDNDQGVAAFDWRDIAGALNLWLDCPETPPEM